MPSLLVTYGHHFGVRYELLPRTSIGRASGCTIQLLDEKVSRTHTTVTLDGERWIVRDEGSSNGTGLNGRLLLEPRPLGKGDEIAIGNNLMLFDPDLDILPDAEGAGAVVLAKPPGPIPEPVAAPGNARFRIEALVSALSSTLTGPQGLSRPAALLEAAMRGLGGDRAALLLAPLGGEPMKAVTTAPHRSRVTVDERLVHKALERRGAVVAEGTCADLVVRQGRSMLEGRGGSALVLPIALGGRVRGVLYVDAPRAGAFADVPAELACGVVEVAFASLLSGDPARLRPVAAPVPVEEPVADSPAMRRAVELARSWSELRGPVVIYGERGAGRAHLAEFMHRTGPRSEGRFEVVRASELPGGAAEPLLFGCEPSVLPGIDAVLPGILERVDGGALFLDDIGDLAAALQVKLVRALQEGRYFRVGGTRPVPMDVRLYAGSRRDLADAVKEGGLREDLDGLLGGMRVTVPPLRMRLADIQGLVARFVRAFELEHGLRCPALSPAASGMLEGYGWPGNVAELKHVLRRLLIRAADDEVSGPLVEAELAALPWGEGAGDPERCKRIAEAERELLSAAMGRSRGRLARAAHLLELDRASLDRALAMHGIDPIPG